MPRPSSHLVAARGQRSTKRGGPIGVLPHIEARNWKLAGVFAAIVTLVFSPPLADLLRLAAHRELYSHIFLLPILVAILLWQRRECVKETPVDGRFAALPFAVLGVLLLVGGLHDSSTTVEDHLAWMIGSYVALLWSVAVYTQGWPRFVVALGPLLLLAFLIPWPLAWESGVTNFLQKGSAATAWMLFQSIGTPVFYNDTVFQLPGFQMMVAPECSGIHSTLSLLIVSLLAGQMLLRSHWRQATLVAAVLPLAFLRNGLRVVTISELCMRKGPEMIDSIYHRQGGPIFFVVTLVPFGALLYYLARRDRNAKENPLNA